MGCRSEFLVWNVSSSWKEAKGGGGVYQGGVRTGSRQTNSMHVIGAVNWPGLAWPGTKQSKSPRSRKAKASKSRGKLTNAQRCASWQFFKCCREIVAGKYMSTHMLLRVSACSCNCCRCIMLLRFEEISCAAKWTHSVALHCLKAAKLRLRMRRRCMVTDTCYMCYQGSRGAGEAAPACLLCWTVAAKLTTAAQQTLSSSLSS